MGIRLIPSYNVIPTHISYPDASEVLWKKTYDHIHSLNNAVLVTLDTTDLEKYANMIDWCVSTFHYDALRNIDGKQVFVFENPNHLNWFMLKWG